MEETMRSSDATAMRLATEVEPSLLPVPHVVAGRIELEMATEYRSRDTGTGFITPSLDLNRLAPPRSVPGPAFALPIREVYDFLEETGKRLTLANPHLRDALDAISQVSTLSPATLTYCYQTLHQFFNRASLEFQV